MKTFKLKTTLAALLCLLLLLTGCGTQEKRESGKLSIVTTVFPVYDWVRECTAGVDNAEITLLLDNGVDLHSYQPGADDMVKVSTCDVFICVGGESDEWVDDALAGAVNENMIVINLLEVLGSGAKEEELVEGMQDEHGHEHDEDEDEAGHEEHGPEYDEHVWLSLKNAAFFCQYISEALCRADAANREAYSSAASAYIAKLNALDAEYAEAVSAAPTRTVLFGDRFPFRYLVDDYGLDYYAAFAGCSAETEASFDTIIFLAGKTDELGLRHILKTESSDGSIADTVRRTTASGDQTVLTLDSLQSTTGKDAAGGKTYLGTMRENLAVLREALN
ncbi:MAG: zinc ABC transporter substrate-binding protein [Clostridia bacterium]|nr:zinc ABC transporter substrate-binding protein [Clostridia bacterium]